MMDEESSRSKRWSSKKKKDHSDGPNRYDQVHICTAFNARDRSSGEKGMYVPLAMGGGEIGRYTGEVCRTDSLWNGAAESSGMRLTSKSVFIELL